MKTNAKNSRLAVIIGVVVVLAIFISNCFAVVRMNQYAVVTRFGKIVKVMEGGGLVMKLPMVDNVRFVPSDLRLYDIDPSDVITKDKKSMIADNYVLWHVTDATKYFQTLSASESVARDRVSVAVYNATKNTISSMTQEELIAARGEKLTSMITKEANSDLGAYGIEIIKSEIKSLDLPNDNKGAVYERMISERQNIAASYKAQGNAEAKKIRNETDKTVSVMKAEADKQAQITIADGEAQYMKIIQAAYDTQDKQDFYSFIRGLDALKQSMSGEKTVVLSADSELARLLAGAEE